LFQKPTATICGANCLSHLVSIITKGGMRQLRKANLTGARFDEVEVTKSYEFEELYPDQELPDFVWLKVDGWAGQDDLSSAGILFCS
jgi:hypothetical protein